MAVYNDATVIGGCPVEEGIGVETTSIQEKRSTPHKRSRHPTRDRQLYKSR
jgi:hypothetical protein